MLGAHQRLVATGNPRHSLDVRREDERTNTMTRMPTVAVILLLLCCGCATVPTQITSNPSGAVILLNGRLIGVTPLSATIPKLDDPDVVNTLVAIKDKHPFAVQVFSTRYIDDRVQSRLPPVIHFNLSPERQDAENQQ